MVLWMQNYAYFAHRRYYNEEPPKFKGTGRTELIYEKHRQLATLMNPAQEKKMAMSHKFDKPKNKINAY
jgi:hypothetical protein